MNSRREQDPTARRNTIARARKLRRDATFPENLLWSRLRGRQLAGLKFRRQHPIGPFNADFYCDEAGLVVEVDRMSHDRRAKEDEHRSAYLRQEGLRVFRVTNDDVLEDVETVLTGILRECGIDLETGERKRDPHPGPLPEGEGE
ncbi:MAG: endonuclease domain-containing protein [Planctomycetia bacterium]|nr:endonuclease domain-containing protein [Planctomycetia bacterium]